MKTATKTRRTQSRALPWFGADTMVCEQYAALMADCKHVTVPFCGGLSVVAHLVETAGEVVCNDKHALALNFYFCISNKTIREEVLSQLEVMPFSAELLEQAQSLCKKYSGGAFTNIDAAVAYFVTAWMGRSGKSGTKTELNGGLAMRWDAGGGSSPLRFHTAVRSIQEVWGPICERCSFVCMDWQDVLAKVKDDPKCGVYLDPPWIGAGDDYQHGFTRDDHVLLANQLESYFVNTKVVLRYGDNALIRELYASDNWTIREIKSRDQANGEVSELCITNFEVPA